MLYICWGVQISVIKYVYSSQSIAQLQKNIDAKAASVRAFRCQNSSTETGNLNVTFFIFWSTPFPYHTNTVDNVELSLRVHCRIQTLTRGPAASRPLLACLSTLSTLVYHVAVSNLPTDKMSQRKIVYFILIGVLMAHKTVHCTHFNHQVFYTFDQKQRIKSVICRIQYCSLL